MTTTIERIADNLMHGGQMNRYKHKSEVCLCEMNFSVYIPPGTGPFPVLYWLSGLTCSDMNFVEKSGAQKEAAKHGILLVVCDTSPRGLGYPGEAESWDFGVAAGFYLDATQEPWKNGYKMNSYLTQELPAIINANFPVIQDKVSISGHSMGGHGALTIALNCPGFFKSVSAFAPISNPSVVPFGIKAFTNYLGEDKEAWKAYDATELVKKYEGPDVEFLIDCGTSDNFLDTQLKPNNLVEAAKDNKHVKVNLRMQEGYNHSYYFVASFIADHMEFHAKHLK